MAIPDRTPFPFPVPIVVPAGGPVRRAPRIVVLLLAAISAWLGSTTVPALEWSPQAGHRRATLPSARPADGAERTGFSSLPPSATGIRFTNRLDEVRSLTNQIFLNGSGVAAGDVDGDGWCDLYFCGLDSPNALYRNLGGWRFEEITAQAGVECADQASTGAALADLDGDGHLDLLVNGIYRGTRLFLGNGRGGFREATAGSGLAATTGSTSLALADVDGDHRLDVYVVNYRSDTMRDMPGISITVGVSNGVRRILSVNRRPADSPDLVGRFTFDPSGGILENGEPDVLFRNLGGGRFERIPWGTEAFLDERGQPVPPPYDWGLSAMFRDWNGDRAPDLYVCNDFQSPDRIWLNDGKGRFRAISRVAFRQTSLFSMGVDFGDLDRDGHDDLFVADMLSREHVRRQVQVMNAMAARQSRQFAGDRPPFSRNTLFRNRGDGTFAEIAQFAGVEASDWTWCPVFLDVDLDGFEDLLAITGHWHDAQDADAAREVDALIEQKKLGPRDQLLARRRFPRLEIPNFAFRNRGDLTFEEMGAAWGFDSLRISQGIALADLDNDGDLDVILNCLNDGPLLLRNETTRPRVAVRLRGRAPNSAGIGARMVVRAAGLPEQSQEMIAGGRYVSSDDAVRCFAAASATQRVDIEIRWRGGGRSRLIQVPADHYYEIDEAGADPDATTSDPRTSAPSPFFEDRSRVLGHQHVDEPFDDFARQPLLPHTLSHPGPGLAWFDFNNDGWEDLFVGAGRGGRIAVFRNDGQGGFIPQRAQVLQTPADRDFTGLLGWRPGPSTLGLLMGLDGYEIPSTTHAPGLRELSLATGQMEEKHFPNAGSTGPMALGDFDLDGDLDLLVGGRVVPGRYPEPASSTLLRNTAGRLEADPAASQALSGAGLVNGATFTDLQGDRRPELALATGWGPIRLFRSDSGVLSPWNPPLRWADPTPHSPPSTAAARPSHLDGLTGWWNSVAAGDFDGDGRMDLVAGNWGRNSLRQAFLHHPIRIYYGEAEGSGAVGLLESHFDPISGKYVPLRDRSALAAVFPTLEVAYPTFAAFARASVEDLLATGLPLARHLDVATLESFIFLNRGDAFEVRPLPAEAQFAPVFGMAVGDFDGDGAVDLVLAQNFFGTGPAESRLDAGWGAWLRGDGQGGFQAVPTPESGLQIYGEGRGAAACDFDHDGRLDFVVGQNRGITSLYRNLRGRPGLRVTLRGGPENPQAIGAVVRAEYRGGRTGPAHELRLGSGYWSQESPTVLLAGGEDPEAVLIRWPRGPVQRVVAPLDESELIVTQPSP